MKISWWVIVENKISISLFYSSLSFIRVIRPVDNFRVILCQIKKKIENENTVKLGYISLGPAIVGRYNRGSL